jgi:hypothetical protein
MLHVRRTITAKSKLIAFAVVGLNALLMSGSIYALPAAGENKVAYYAFDATTVGQTMPSLTNFTNYANIVVVFEGTLWELADTAHYNTGWMRNAVYSSKKQILDDIQILRKRGVLVLMNVDDAASWSTATPFTTWNGKALNYTQFALFVDSCVTAADLDGISLDVEHKATDNTYYRNLIKEFGKYFGPLSSNASKKMYVGAFYSGKDGPPGPIFREVALSQYLNFVMDMGYKYNNTDRFNYWAATLGNAKVMIGMSHQDNSQSSAVSWASWHPTPDKAGVMVFAANVSKTYTDAIFAALGGTTVRPHPALMTPPHASLYFDQCKHSIIFRGYTGSNAGIALKIVSMRGALCRSYIKNQYDSGGRYLYWNLAANDAHVFSSGVYVAVLDVNGTVISFPFVME